MDAQILERRQPGLKLDTFAVPGRLDSLDLVRGVAALLVLMGHLRAYVLQSYGEASPTGMLLSAFYFVTGLGHQAVIVFFALSGFLVGGKALHDLLARRFFWSRYLLRRFTRLWIVIGPALLLTMLLDNIGLAVTRGVGYDGRFFDMYAVGPGAGGVDDSWRTFTGNLAFLQTIDVPNFGSNGPIWSLANEFWYYIVFPLAAWLVFTPSGRLPRVGGLLLLIFLGIMLPPWLLQAGAIWVAGAAAAWCISLPALARFLVCIPARIGAVVLLVSAIILSRSKYDWFGDIELGLVVALVLPVVATLPSPGRLYSALAKASSDFSFTLYLTHFPLLTLIVFVGFAPTRLAPGVFAFAAFSGLASIAIGWAAFWWWCFERNTDRVFALLVGRLPTLATAAPDATSQDLHK
jgi:peptidoglycan/LPS O-acetylase OafA/YrhL